MVSLRHDSVAMLDEQDPLNDMILSNLSISSRALFWALPNGLILVDSIL